MALDWNHRLAKIIGSLDNPDFARNLSLALKSVVDFEYTVIFGYVGTAQPLALYDDFPKARRVMHVDEYVAGPYLLDPFYQASANAATPGLWRLSEIAPDRFYQGEYFRNYYAQTGLAEEIGYLVQVHDRLSIVVSLMRKEKRFTKAEIKSLKLIWPIIQASCQRHWGQTARDGADDASDLEQNIALAFRTLGEGLLTPREREVVEHTLRGHSADAVGKLLGISSGTVRIHRKNVYAKLRINSQGELFSVFLTTITDQRLGSYEKPADPHLAG
ncbi:MAG: helix-turn-helix transcriptional regulator [Pseudomonadota bacterium]